MAKPKFTAPKGTRDLYPDDLLRRRYVTQVWRDTAVRHGFSEIDGPTFETSDLYAVKSGDGILGELFQAYSGKSPEEVARVQETGQAPFALRPEFTPTLARMYAARAKQLPQPTRWFSIGPFFRAERPQRGRLREFLQWNADVLGETPDNGSSDAELANLIIASCDAFGIASSAAKLHCSDRDRIAECLRAAGVSDSGLIPAFELLDRRAKLPYETIAEQATAVELDLERFDALVADAIAVPSFASDVINASERLRPDPSIVRGLAYYTGTVFEVIAEGERAVAGGGRYDNLIELLGGPPTPAVGMAMGDVVLMNLLDDLGLMPEGQDLLEAVSRPPAPLRPDLFIVTPHEDLDQHARRLAAELRRSPDANRPDTKPWQRAPGLHARVTDKSTRKVNKLIEDARANAARRLLILESDSEATLTDLDHKDAERQTLPLDAGAIRAAATA